MYEFDKPNAFRYVQQWIYLYIQFFLQKRKEKERHPKIEKKSETNS